MNKKQVNIIIILAIVVVLIFAGLGFIGFGGFGTVSEPPQTGAQAILDEIQQTGTVADLRVQDTVVGTGDPVMPGDTVSVVYIGVLPDGTIFDSTEAQGGAPYTFVVGQGAVIAGWDQGLIGMKEGGRRLLAIPPALGYGPQGNGPIPPNATLLFDVQIVKRMPAGSVPEAAVSQP